MGKHIAAFSMLGMVLSQLLVTSPAPCSAQNSVTAVIAPLAELAVDFLTSGAFTDLSALGGPAIAMSSELFNFMQQALLDAFGMDASALTTWLLNAAAGGSNGLLSNSDWSSSGYGWRSAAGSAAGSGSLGLPPPPLPPLPSGHPLAPWANKNNLALRVVADKWASSLVKMQYSPGLQGFLNLLGLSELQEALVKWVCILFPWQPTSPAAAAFSSAFGGLPDALAALRDAYCVKALPAAAVTKILGGGPLGGGAKQPSAMPGVVGLPVGKSGPGRPGGPGPLLGKPPGSGFLLG